MDYGEEMYRRYSNMLAMQEDFSCWCLLVLDHILARKLCSASLSRQRIPEAEGFYRLCIIAAKSGMTSKSWTLLVVPVTSHVCFPALFSSWIVTLKCPPAAAVHLTMAEQASGVSQRFVLICVSEAL